MAVRHFDGVDDNITFDTPAVGGHAYTFAALIQKNADTSSLSFFCGREGAGGGANVEAMGFDANYFGVGNDHQIVSADNGTIGTITVADDWMILVGRIPEPDPVLNPTPAPQFSAYSFATGTWTHENPGHGYDVAAANPGGLMRVGYLVGLESFKAAFSLGAIGYWNVELTEAEAEQLATNLATNDWANVHPEVLEYLADFNQASVATAVTDLSGNGLVQSGITGTSVLTDNDPPGWTFGVSAAEPEQHSGSAVVSGGGTVSASGRKRASAAAVASGAGTASASGRKTARGSATASGAGATAASGTKRGRVSVLVSGSGASSASGTKRAHQTVSLSGTGATSATGTKRAHGSATATGGGSVTAAGHSASGGPDVSDLPTSLALDPHATSASVDARLTTVALGVRSTTAVLNGRTTTATLAARVTTLSLAARSTSAALDDRTTEVILDG